MDAFSMSVPGMEHVWPTADWRLSRINYPGTGVWHDANALIDWIGEQVKSADDDDFAELDNDLNMLLIAIVTGDTVKSVLSKFRRVSYPLPIRVVHFHGCEPFDCELTQAFKT